MDLFTLDADFRKDQEIDSYKSAIWNERYYGDGDVTLVVPATPENVAIFAPGTFLGLRGSKEINILETQNIESGILTITGISLLKWLVNRFIRVSADHEVKTWLLSGHTPGAALKTIVQEMCIDGDYLDGTVNIGIPVPVLTNFKIPGLTIASFDNTGSSIDFSVPFEPVFDALKDIATTYEVGMSIYLISATDVTFVLGFKSYRGLDRRSSQTVNPTIRFSPDLESLTGIKELRSSNQYKNLVYAFSSSNLEGLATTPGVAGDTTKSGFDLQVSQVWSDNITEEQVAGSGAVLLGLLNQKAASSMDDNKYVALVDGEIVPGGQIEFDHDYYLGDVVEIQGYSGIVTDARVTEYIRVDDETGERAYPTLSLMD